VSVKPKIRISLGRVPAVIKSNVVSNQTKTAMTMKQSGNAAGDEARNSTARADHKKRDPMTT
jgi:hypothetical protein